MTALSDFAVRRLLADMRNSRPSAFFGLRAALRPSHNLIESTRELATQYAFGCQSRRREELSRHGHEPSRDDPGERQQTQQTVSSRSQPAGERELPTRCRLSSKKEADVWEHYATAPKGSLNDGISTQD
jgi:hypothetical protein